MNKLILILLTLLSPTLLFGQAGSSSNFLPRADILIISSNHLVTPKNALANTNVARGTALIAAVNAAVNGDLVTFGPGTYDLGSGTLDLSAAGTKAVHLRGPGMYAATITSTGPIANGAIVHPGSGSEISGFTITASLTDTTYQAPLGKASADTNFTSCWCHHIRINGQSDGIYITSNVNTGVCNMRAQDMEINTTYDAVTVLGTAANVIRLSDSVLTVTGPNPQGTTTSRGVAIQGNGTGIIRNCDITSSNGGATKTTGISAVANGGGTPTTYVYGCRIRTSGASGTISDLEIDPDWGGGNFYVDTATDYDPIKVDTTSGGLSYIGNARFGQMTTTQRDAIVTPIKGMMIYNTTTNKINFYNGSAWVAITSA